jgi:DNA (cytosine-5)-methyltransferase 3A
MANYEVRKFHPIEAERLQTYPDNYTAAPSLSKTRRYELIGNAFTVDVIAYILEGIKEDVES